jgi:hypothetical protein
MRTGGTGKASRRRSALTGRCDTHADAMTALSGGASLRSTGNALRRLSVADVAGDVQTLREREREITTFIIESGWAHYVPDVPDTPVDQWGSVGWARFALVLVGELQRLQDAESEWQAKAKTRAEHYGQQFRRAEVAEARLQAAEHALRELVDAQDAAQDVADAFTDETDTATMIELLRVPTARIRNAWAAARAALFVAATPPDDVNYCGNCGREAGPGVPLPEAYDEECPPGAPCRAAAPPDGPRPRQEEAESGDGSAVVVEAGE